MDWLSKDELVEKGQVGGERPDLPIKDGLADKV